VNMYPGLVKIRSVTSEIRRKKEEKTTAVKYKPFDIAMLCGLNMNTSEGEETGGKTNSSMCSADASVKINQ